MMKVWWARFAFAHPTNLIQFSKSHIVMARVLMLAA
jgi:hypothetical protein